MHVKGYCYSGTSPTLPKSTRFWVEGDVDSTLLPENTRNIRVFLADSDDRREWKYLKDYEAGIPLQHAQRGLINLAHEQSGR